MVEIVEVHADGTEEMLTSFMELDELPTVYPFDKDATYAKQKRVDDIAVDADSQMNSGCEFSGCRIPRPLPSSMRDAAAPASGPGVKMWGSRHAGQSVAEPTKLLKYKPESRPVETLRVPPCFPESPLVIMASTENMGQCATLALPPRFDSSMWREPAKGMRGGQFERDVAQARAAGGRNRVDPADGDSDGMEDELEDDAATEAATEGLEGCARGCTGARTSAAVQRAAMASAGAGGEAALHSQRKRELSEGDLIEKLADCTCDAPLKRPRFTSDGTSASTGGSSMGAAGRGMGSHAGVSHSASLHAQRVGLDGVASTSASQPASVPAPVAAPRHELKAAAVPALTRDIAAAHMTGIDLPADPANHGAAPASATATTSAPATPATATPATCVPTSAAAAAVAAVAAVATTEATAPFRSAITAIAPSAAIAACATELPTAAIT
uniref:Uncharacterized protein n=1 Tax=Chrysotila carterae TaxID=13221 RepID=A0A7S4F353_CHRCT